MSDVTRILSQIEQGDSSEAGQLLPLVYDELRKLAAAKLLQEKPGQTLQATALVHEAYLRLVGTSEGECWDSRGHFFAAAAEAMRRILVDRARARASWKRGGGHQRLEIDIDSMDFAVNAAPHQLLEFEEAMEQLAELDPLAKQVVQLRYFGGLTIDQAALVLDVSRASAYRHWNYARAWLYDRLTSSG